MTRVTVQALDQRDGEFTERSYLVNKDSEQDAVDYLFARAKEEMGYKFLGAHGYIAPTGQTAHDFGERWGQWYVTV